MVCGAPGRGSLDPIASAAEQLPAAVGVKLIVSVRLWPGARVASPVSLVMANFPASAPVRPRTDPAPPTRAHAPDLPTPPPTPAPPLPTPPRRTPTHTRTRAPAGKRAAAPASVSHAQR